MKETLSVLKWCIQKSKPFVLQIVLIMVFGVILSLCVVSIAMVSKKFIDFTSAGQLHQAITYVVIFIILIVLQVTLQFLISVLSGQTLEGLSNHLREKTFKQLLDLEWMDFSRYHSGDIVTRLTSDVNTISNFIVNTLPDFVSSAVRLLASFLTLLFLEPVLAILAFILAPVSILISRLWAKKMKQLYTNIQQSESKYRSVIQEAVENILIVKAFCEEKKSINRVSELHKDRLNLVSKRYKLSSASNSILSLGYWLGYFLAFCWGAVGLSKGTATFGSITAFIQLVDQIHYPFLGLAYSIPQFIQATACISRLNEFDTLASENNSNYVPCWREIGILAENMSFSYKGDKAVLNNINFKITPGETIAISAPSGSGKTTLIKLLLSFIQPQSGHLYFTDNLGEKSEIDASSRKLISYVPQGNTLFSGTIADNLRLGSPDASYKDMEEACVYSCAWEFITALPDGLNTVIGEHGIGLSEGQAQRLAITRALIKKAPILILDEATSSLDIETERKVLEAICGLKPRRTTIVISHRPAALEICSRVFKIENAALLEYQLKTAEQPFNLAAYTMN